MQTVGAGITRAVEKHDEELPRRFHRTSSVAPGPGLRLDSQMSSQLSMSSSLRSARVTDEVEDPGATSIPFPSLSPSYPANETIAARRWRTAFNRYRVANAFNQQLTIHRGIYGSVDEGAWQKTHQKVVPQTGWLGITALNPNTGFRKFWDLGQALLLVYVAIMVPYRVGFRDPAIGASLWLETFIDLYFVVDVVLNFVTGYNDEENEVGVQMDFKMIAKKYLKLWFWIDFVAILPIDLINRGVAGELVCSFSVGGCSDTTTLGNSFSVGGCDDTTTLGNTAGDMGALVDTGDNTGALVRLVKLLRLFRLLKLLRLVRIQRMFERYQDDVFDFLPAITVIKLLVMLLYLGHAIGCFYMFCSHPDFRTAREEALVQEGIIVPWLVIEFGCDVGAMEAFWRDRYITSMYWAFTTMTTVGYGDISAVTVAERASAITGMIMGGFVFSYIIGTISEVIANLDLSHRSHTKKMQCVSQFVKDNNLLKGERVEVLKYFRMQSVQAYGDSELLMEMPYQLRKNVVYYIYRDVLKKIPFFQDSRELMKVEICSRFQFGTYPAGALVYQKSEASGSLFVVARGLVEMLDGNLEDLSRNKGEQASDRKESRGAEGRGNDVLAKLTEGSYFGEELIMGLSKRVATVKCRPATQFYILESDDLMYFAGVYPYLNDHFVHNFELRQKKLKERAALRQQSMKGEGANNAVGLESQESFTIDPDSYKSDLRSRNGTPVSTPKNSMEVAASKQRAHSFTTQRSCLGPLGNDGYRVGAPIKMGGSRGSSPPLTGGVEGLSGVDRDLLMGVMQRLDSLTATVSRLAEGQKTMHEDFRSNSLEVSRLGEAGAAGAEDGDPSSSQSKGRSKRDYFELREPSLVTEGSLQPREPATGGSVDGDAGCSSGGLRIATGRGIRDSEGITLAASPSSSVSPRALGSAKASPHCSIKDKAPPLERVDGGGSE